MLRTQQRRVCKACGYESALFDPAINLQHSTLSEALREEALRRLRESNFADLLGMMKPHLSRQHRTLLEVGCGHGWFLKAAAQRFAAVGIEPDHQLCSSARATGAQVIEGYFPGALEDSDKFDVIVFNDVFEHIPDPQATLNACLRILNDGGLLVLNLPDSQGSFYRLAKMAKRIGFAGPFARLWQKGFPSPHLHYFSRSNLEMLLRRCGWRVASSGALPSIRLTGLYNRIAYADPSKRLRHAMVWLTVALLYPAVKWFPSDAMVVLAVRHDAARNARTH